MSNPSIDPVCQHQPADGWGTRRVWIAGAIATMLPGSKRILDFWPLGAGGSFGFVARMLFDLSGVLLVLVLVGFVVGLLITAGIALWRRHSRRVASSIFAIAAIPICYAVVAEVPLFDPWLWYAMTNRTRFKALAAGGSPSDEPKYAMGEIWDVSTGLAGLSPNHFIALIYDESDAVGLEPSERPSIWRTRTMWPGVGSNPIPKGRRLYGHFFRVDDFE